MPIVVASALLGIGLVIALVLRRPSNAPSIERTATHGYSKGFKALTLTCLIAHTGFFTVYAYNFASADSSPVWQIGVWEFGGFAILAWWLVLEAFFTVGWVNAEGVGVRRLGMFEKHLAWSEIESARESRMRGVLLLKGAGKSVPVPNHWGLNPTITEPLRSRD